MTTPQQRWGYWPQQPYWPPPPPPPPPQTNGWQQQSKWRRPLQQQISLTNPPTNVYLLTAKFTLTAYSPFVVIGGVGWQQQSKWRRPLQQQISLTNPPTNVYLLTAQFTLTAYPVQVVIGGVGWQQQSKWRRPVQQPISFSPPPAANVTVSLLTASFTLTAYPPAIIVGGNQPPQHRWGYWPQTYPSSGIPPVSTGPITVSLLAAQFTLTAYPVQPVIGGGRMLPQSKWRRKLQQQISPSIQPVRGSGAQGFIRITYATVTGRLNYSLSGAVQLDQYGNQLARGYQGPVAALQPLVSTPTATEVWHALPLVSAQAGASGNGVNGFWYIYRSNNEVELLWDINCTNTGGAYIAVMPPGYIPLTQQNFISGWYGNGPSTYQNNFQPHLNIQGIHDPVPGAIYTFGGNVQPLAFFGRGKYALVRV